MIKLNDTGLLELYRTWSEENYAAQFISPDPYTVKEFRMWLRELGTREEPRWPRQDYETKMLDEFWRQEEEDDD